MGSLAAGLVTAGIVGADRSMGLAELVSLRCAAHAWRGMVADPAASGLAAEAEWASAELLARDLLASAGWGVGLAAGIGRWRRTLPQWRAWLWRACWLLTWRQVGRRNWWQQDEQGQSNPSGHRRSTSCTDSGGAARGGA